VKAVIKAESAFDPNAVSPKGAHGPHAIDAGHLRDLGVANPFDPYENIDGGARYLKALLQRFNNDLRLALAAYNAGPETVQKHGAFPLMTKPRFTFSGSWNTTVLKDRRCNRGHVYLIPSIGGAESWFAPTPKAVWAQ